MNLYVFDVDGTLYDLNDVVAQNYEIQVEYYCSRKKCTRGEAVVFFEQNQVYPKITEQSRSATELFLLSGFDRDDWNAFRQKRYPVESIKTEHAVEVETLMEFKKLGPCVILSSNSLATIRRILDRLSIPISLFDQIVCSDVFPCDRPFNKKDAFRWIKETMGKGCERMYSIGDRLNTDILPACEVGYTGILVRSPVSLGQLLYDFQSGQENNLGYQRFECNESKGDENGAALV